MTWTDERRETLSQHLADQTTALEQCWRTVFACPGHAVSLPSSAGETEPPADAVLLGTEEASPIGFSLRFESDDLVFTLIIPDAAFAGTSFASDGPDSEKIRQFAAEMANTLFPADLGMQFIDSQRIGDILLSLTGFDHGETTRNWRFEVASGPDDSGDSETEDAPNSEGEADSDDVNSTPAGGSASILLIGPVIKLELDDEIPLGESELPAPQVEIPAHIRTPLLGSILNLRVTVAVELARKRIDISQLLAIGPGALLQFNKPCEQPLTLYVNNAPHCHGEAVKIGEKFGLKVDGMGPPPEKTDEQYNSR